MKDHVPHWRDDEHARGYAASIHRLNQEPVLNNPKPTWRRPAVVGVTLGAIGYLLTSCFLEQQLDKPKIERAKIRSGHAHQAATPGFDVQ